MKQSGYHEQYQEAQHKAAELKPAEEKKKEEASGLSKSMLCRFRIRFARVMPGCLASEEEGAQNMPAFCLKYSTRSRACLLCVHKHANADCWMSSKMRRFLICTCSKQELSEQG
eukprot:485903-Amphidinium_carterae.1